jgi:hypothetical protein
MSFLEGPGDIANPWRRHIAKTLGNVRIIQCEQKYLGSMCVRRMQSFFVNPDSSRIKNNGKTMVMIRASGPINTTMVKKYRRSRDSRHKNSEAILFCSFSYGN